MTFFGKLMVVLTAVLSLAVLAWATAVSTHSVDWFPPKGQSAQEVKGRVNELKDRISGLVRAAERAQYQWDAGRRELAQAEQERAQRLAWYAGQLELVRQGTIGGRPQPPPHVQTLELDPATGRLPLGQPTGRRPELAGNNQPLLNLTAYAQTIDNSLRELQDLQQQVAGLIKEEEQWTNLIIDTPDRKGLRTLIKEQEQILRDSLDEQAYLLPHLTNRRAEVALVERRQRSLQGRVDEVKQYYGTGGAAGR
ncbi:MAG TPA: hypothetical protein VIL46_18430 [Gemmataceae bacterium]